MFWLYAGNPYGGAAMHDDKDVVYAVETLSDWQVLASLGLSAVMLYPIALLF